MREITVSEALREGLREEMRRDERVFVAGEDIARYGGTFKVTDRLLDEFGPERIVGTAISENAIVGLGVGAALIGMRPVSEIMFSDWLTCGMDQLINYAAMLTYAYGGKARLPLVVRTTVGTHGGPQHSKSLEAWIAHVPGLKVVMPSTPYDAKGLIKSAIRDDNPVVMFEHRHLYFTKGPVPEKEYLVPIGKAEVKRAGDDITMIATSHALHDVLAAAHELAQGGISVEVVDPRTLAPLDDETLLASARKTGRVLIVHEAWRTGGIGAEIAARINEAGFHDLRQPVRRLCHLDVPHPYSPALEQEVMPTPEKIVAAARAMVTSNQPERPVP